MLPSYSDSSSGSNGKINDSSTSADQGDGDEIDDALEKDKSSQKSTLGGTATPSKHRKDKTASDAAHSSSGEKPSSRAGVKKTSKSKKKKKSIWSKLASAFFHCTWSADNPHDVDIDERAPGVSDPSSSSLEPKEKPAHIEQPKEDVKEVNVPIQSSSNADDKETIVKTPDDAVPLTIAPDLVPPPISDPAVVIPPSPTTQVRTEDLDGLTSGSVQPPGSTGREHENESEDTGFTDDEMDKEMQEAEDEEDRLIREGGAGIPIGPDGMPRPLLPPIAPQHAGRKCLVLDLDETLVHSSFKVSHICHCCVFVLTTLSARSRYSTPTMSFQLRSNIIGTTCMSSRGQVLTIS